MTYRPIGLEAKARTAELPSITIRKDRMIALNTTAYQQLGEPAAIKFEWDDETSNLRIRCCAREDPYGFALHAGNKRIRGAYLLKELGITHDGFTRTLPLQPDGHTALVADLSRLKAAR